MTMIKNEIDRRSFFKWSGLSVLGMMMYDKIRPSIATGATKSYWNEEGYFHQDNVDISDIDQGIIRAKVQNWPGNGWRKYNVVSAELGFITWNFTERITRIDKMIEGVMPAFGGAHNPFVASCGLIPPDPTAWNRSQFSLNNAVKGMGLAPKKATIDSVFQGLEDHWDDSEDDRLLHLKAMYTDRTLWDMNKQVSLELYATPINNTHSFLNWMENPFSNIGYMALEFKFYPPPLGMKLPTYELRTITHMIHPLDPDVDEYEFKLIKFSNWAHDFYHHSPGQPPPEPEDMNIGVIHYILEEFDNYWTNYNGRSKRVASLRILDWPKGLYAKVLGKTKQFLA